MHAIDAEALRRHIGTRIEDEDVASRRPLQDLVATFDRPESAPREGEEIPVGWHVGYFPVSQATSELGADGLPNGTGVLPPMPLPRRMYAGNRIAFHQPIRVGDRLRREIELTDLQVRTGNTGTMIVTTQTRRIFTPRGLAIVEEYDNVFREAVPPGAKSATAKREAPPPGLAWSRSFDVSIVMLFRFSALTGNPHRIHYDRPYATEAEGYPALVVHGPFLQTCLLDFMRDHARQPVRSFSMRARAPLFDTEPVTLVGGLTEDGRGCSAWAIKPDGTIATETRATF